MSTEINIEKLYENCIKILTDLIGFKTISGEDNNSLIDYCDNILKDLGASSFRTFDEDKKRVNLFATIKAKNTSNKKPIILSGHTDVVPVGDENAWSSNPFDATEKNGKLYGRGASDMKSAIAAFVLAVREYLENNQVKGTISLLITNDEEGPAINGTKKVLE